MAKKDEYSFNKAEVEYGATHHSDHNSNNNLEVTEDDITSTTRVGVSQAPAFRDKWFAIAYLCQILLVLMVAFISGFPAISRTDDVGGRNLKENDHEGRFAQAESNGRNVFTDDQTDNEDYDIEFWQTFGSKFVSSIFLVSVIFALLLSFGALALLAQHAQVLIQACLIFSIVINALLFFTGLASSDPSGSFLFLVLALIAAWYAKVVWSRVPYAASTLKCAVTAVRGNFGLTLLALGTVPVTLIWTVFWIISLYGAFTWNCMYTTIAGDSSFEADDTSEQTDISSLGSFIIFLFIFSYYWSIQVIANSNRTTIAGVIGTWCFNPSNASSFCSTAIRDSFIRSNTFSLGSIAFGSLIVAIIQLIKDWATSMRNRNRGNVLYCCLECLLVYIERIAQYFHKWAFVYVGLYGYGYIDAGKTVMNLFQQRGFTAIISDSLTRRMLYLISVYIGLIVGLVCGLVGMMFGGVQVGDGEEMNMLAFLAFFSGLILGSFLSFLIMGVVGDSVDAIIVCFAEAPADFKRNHPALHDEMSLSWSNMTAVSPVMQQAATAVAVGEVNNGAGIV